MQKQGIMLWLLLGMIWLLAGCVAPDGSVIRFKQAPDGTIVGWEVDAPVEEAATNASMVEHSTSYPSRPILYTVWREDDMPTIHAVDRDGASLGVVGNGFELGWSPTGDRFTYWTRGNAEDTMLLVVASLAEQGQPIIETVGDFPWQSAWSPDGTQIALLLDNEESSRVVTLDVTNREVSGEFLLSTNSSSDLGDYASGDFGIPSITWSPNAEKLLVEWVDTMVIDIESGTETKVIGPELISVWPVDLVEWLPTSDGLFFLDFNESGLQLWRKRLNDEKPELLLTSEQLAMQGVAMLYENELRLRDLRLSPAGTYLTVTDSAVLPGEHSILLIYDLTTMLSKPTTNGLMSPPVAQWMLLGTISPVVWGPDGQSLAFMMFSDQGATLEILTMYESSSYTVTELNLTQEQTMSSWYINMVSWMP